jgi:DNA polymerase III epsilon subunit-like protein
MRTYFLDTETTGLHPPEDAIVELAIVDEAGRPVVNTLLNPGRPIGFATSIHGITDAMVSRSPRFEDVWPEVKSLLSGQHVVIYNASFDRKFFPGRLGCAAQVSCAMRRFAPLYGERSLGFKSYRWQKLIKAAEHIGYRWEGQAHRALADAMAARAVWRWMESRAAA